MRPRPPLVAAVVVGLAGVGLSGCTDPVPTIPAGFSYEEAVALTTLRHDYDLGLILQEFPEAHVTDLPFVQLAENRNEWSELQAACLETAGLAGVTATPSGYSISGDNDPRAEAIAKFQCRYAYPLDPRVLGALSEAQLAYAWDYFVERTVPCMRTLGYEPSIAVERDAFIQYGSRVWGAILWSPYGRFSDPFFGPDRQIVDTSCPPLPDDPFALFNGTLTARIRGD